MLSDFVTKLFLAFFGYAYPAFECFKTLEKEPISNLQLRFWCQYWIIVTSFNVIERVARFSSWLPMYGDAKVAFFVYLWFPKTKGSDLVYEAFLRPFVMQYEPDMEERLKNLGAKSGNLLQFYLKNFTDKGRELFLDSLNYVASHPLRASREKSAPIILQQEEERQRPRRRWSRSSLEVVNAVGMATASQGTPGRDRFEVLRNETVGLELTAEELEEDAVVAESLRTAGSRWRQSTRSRARYFSFQEKKKRLATFTGN